jgi:hypothetical protein
VGGLLFERTRRDARTVAKRADLLAKRTEIYTRATTVWTLAAVWVAGTFALVSVGIVWPIAMLAVTGSLWHGAWLTGSEARQAAPLPDDMQTEEPPFTSFLRESLDAALPMWLQKWRRKQRQPVRQITGNDGNAPPPGAS